MAVAVDYRCPGCGAVTALRLPSPPPAAAPCGACGAEARRLYTFSVGRRASAPTAAPGPKPAAPPCKGNADVPLLCHVDPSAAPGWIARYRGDNRALDQHLERIESTPPPAAPAPSGHSHGRGHHHHHADGSA